MQKTVQAPALTHRKCQSGTMLLVAAVLVGIIASFMAFGLFLFKPEAAEDMSLMSKHKMEALADHIARFAHSNYRVPCPADPTIDPVTSSYGAEDPACSDNVALNLTRLEGHVPFRTLGISYDDTLDGYGNSITYAVSPVVADNETIADNGIDIHDLCRLEEDWGDNGTNLHPLKAKFCCPGLGGAFYDETRDLNISNGSTLVMPHPGYTVSRASGSYGDIDSLVVGAPNDHAVLHAITLISHGQGSAVSDDEIENIDNDRLFVQKATRTAQGVDYYDDIVVTRTQTQLWAEFNNSSCRTALR